MANVVFLWHMHQPYYVNPTSRVAMMPWVRLHAVKGYLDMVSVLADFPGVKVNFNLTPVLMLQIEELAQGKIRDLWLDWSRTPAADLDENERLAILEHFFKIQHENLLCPYPRYTELLAKRGANLIIGTLVTLALRLAGIRWRLALPVFEERAREKPPVP